MGVLSLSTELIKKVTLAYEPVWAIGTGVTASTDQIQEIHQFIRNLISQRFDETISNSIRILYGGSVKPTNAVEIFNLADVDGGLIGGASLKFADFQSIVEAADV
jgi:triosephosphate isomerase